MSKQQPPALATIDLDALSTAAGGRRAAGASSSRVADDRILDALRDVTSALKDLGTKQAAATSNTSNNDSMMLMMTMMQGLLGNQNNGGCKR
jgi:hypothetical protein